MTTKLDKFFKNQGIQPIGTLAHVGVKGMKWGVRRSDAELAKANSSSADAARAAATQKAIKKGGTSAVSDADLNHLVNRISLEKRYADIKTSTSVSTKTHSKIRTLLSAADTINTAIRFTASPAGRMIAKQIGLDKAVASASKAIKDSKVATNPPPPPKEPKD